MEKKLEVKNLVLSFRTQGGKVQAVRDVSFDLYKGETLAIVGESGSGKSVTIRAIMGILANNAIVEGGKILYDGKDLLKISEDDFHKIRGDKIAMIFQDPLSSLNPIMRIGKQLTEAMLLKGKAGQKNARRDFNATLKELNRNMDEAEEVKTSERKNNEDCHIFDSFCIAGTKLEGAYNQKVATVVKIADDVSNATFLYNKKQRVDLKRIVIETISKIYSCVDPDVVVLTDSLNGILASIKFYLTAERTPQADAECVRNLELLSAELDAVLKKEKPNFFTLGYYRLQNPDENLDGYTIAELNAKTRKYLDDNFMIAFISAGEKAIKHSRAVSVDKKRLLLEEIKKAQKFFESASYTRKEACAEAAKLYPLVENAIDRLSIIKNSTEYTFKSSFSSAIDKYFDSLERNPKIEARYKRRLAARERLVAKGKTPDWKVAPPMLINSELAKKNIDELLTALYESTLNDVESEKSLDATKEMIAVVDFLKEKASDIVYKITKKLAKAKALRLLEEVGIPEARIRYNQYPFEFSGGMRQRVVIAIALAANPDILICDEPTTALDVTIQAQILELINNLKTERKLSVIFITHDLGVVANMADKIAVMYAGKIVEHGTADEIFYDPRHPYTWALLSSMPDLDTKDKLEAIPGTPPNMIFPPKGDAFAPRNKYCMKIDFEEQPPMFEISPTHYAATWLLHPDAPKVAPPKIVTDRIARMKKEAEEL